MNDLCRFTQSCSVRKPLWTLNLVYLNDVTEYNRRFELVELTNSTLPKCQFQFRSLENFNSNSNHFGSIPIQFQFRSELTPALLMRYRLSKSERPWHKPLKVTKSNVIVSVNSQYVFLFMFNSNVRPNSAPLQDIRLQNLSDLDFDRQGQMWWCHLTLHIWFPVDT